MPESRNDSELAQRFRSSADAASSRAPLNAALCAVIADHPSLSALLGHAPAAQQLPVLLLAAIHCIVLDQPDSSLAAWYPNITPQHRDPHDDALESALRTFVDDHAAEVIELVASRRVQTNEIGRCALFLPAFAMIGRDSGPIAHVDIGTSAGLNTLMRHYAFRYDDGEAIATPDGAASGIELRCATRGFGPVPTAMPEIATAIGVDSAPIDVTNAADARWLEACCWPDQADRFRRLHDAIEVGRRHPPEIRVDDAVGALRSTLIADIAALGHPVLTTSWVMNYLTSDDRVSFVAEFDRLGRERDISWVSAEAPAMTPELPRQTASDDDAHPEHRTVLTLVRWRDGRRSITDLAVCHPHGYWLHWQ